MEQPRTIDLSTRSLVRLAVWVAVCAAGWWFRDILILVLIAVVLAAALDPTITRLASRGIPRVVALIAVFVVVGGLLVVIAGTFIPAILNEGRDFLLNLPSTIGIFATKVLHLAPDTVARLTTDATTTAVNWSLRWFPGAWFGVLRGMGTVVNVLAVLLLMYFFTRRERGMQDLVVDFVPWRHRPYVVQLFHRIEDRLGRWLLGQLTVGLIIAVMVGIGLTAFRIPYALVLALFAGFCELIPMVGPYVAMVPAALVALSVSPLTAVWIILMFYAIQQIENNLISPRILGKAVGQKPLVVIVAILAGAAAAGVLGIILAIPLLIIATTFLEDFRGRSVGATKSPRTIHV